MCIWSRGLFLTICLGIGMCPYAVFAFRHLLRYVVGEKDLGHLWAFLPHFLAFVPIKEQVQRLLISSLPSPHLSKASFDKTRTFQGRSVKIRIIKQKEQRYKRNKRQKHRITSRGTLSEYRILLI